VNKLDEVESVFLVKLYGKEEEGGEGRKRQEDKNRHIEIER